MWHNNAHLLVEHTIESVLELDTSPTPKEWTSK